MEHDQALPPADSGDNLVPFVVLGSYLVLLLILGFVSYRRSKVGEEDYYLAGRGQGWLVSSLTIMATFFSSWALLGAPGKVYTEGLVFALFALNVPLSGACVYLFGRGIARLGRKHGYVTPGDMIADYYGGEAIRVLTALTCLLYVVPYVVMQIKAGGILFDALVTKEVFESIGLDNFEAGAILLSAITTLYIMIGGMRSVAWTDVIQGTMLIIGMLLGGYVVIEVLGGPISFAEKVTRDIPAAWLTAPGTTGLFGPIFLFSLVFFGSTGTMVSPAQWMRYYSASSTSTLKKSAVIFALVLTACFLFGVMLVGIGGLLLYPCPTSDDGGPLIVDGKLQLNEEVKRPDQVLVLVLHEQLPRLWPTAGIWIASIMIMAIAAGSMSTADSNLHALSAVLTRDVYDRYLRPEASDRERTWVGRLIILLATVAALVLVVGSHQTEQDAEASALQSSLKMIVDIGILAISFSLQLLPATIDMLWIRRASRQAVTLGLTAGLMVTAMMKFYPPGFLQGLSVGSLDIKMMAGAWGIFVNVLVIAAISAFTPAPERREEYAETLR